MPELNGTTVILLNGVVSTLMFLALRAIRRALPQEIRALDAWSGGYFCFALASLLYLLRGSAPPVLSITLAGTLFSFGMFLLCQGFYRFRGQELPDRFMLAVALLLLLAYGTFTHLLPDYRARVILIALTGVATHGAILRLYLGAQRSAWRIGERLTVIAIAFAFAAYLLRLWGVFLGDMEHTRSLQTVGQGTWFFAYLVLLNGAQILLANALFVLTQERVAEKLRDTVSHDALTGALARSAILARLDAARASAARNGDRWAVIMIDLDRFKAINDEHGHAVGDRVLQAVVSTMRDHLRLDSHLGRYGGEEFLVVARIRAPGEGLQLAERIRSAVADSVISTAAGPVRCTLSAGVAELDGAGPAGGLDALALADRALYDAKDGGRNRACAPLPVATGQAAPPLS